MHWLPSSISSSIGRWLKASEWILLIFGIIVVAGLVGELIGEKRKSPFWGRCTKISAILVIVGVAGELLGDGGVFLFSGLQQTEMDNLVSQQGASIGGLSTQLKAAQDALATAIKNNAVMIAAQEVQSQKLRQLETRESGPFTWTMSLTAPTVQSPPGQTTGAYNFASFVPDKDITITRIVSPFLGVSGVTGARQPGTVLPPAIFLSQ
jgi:hypothetical protein